MRKKNKKNAQIIWAFYMSQSFIYAEISISKE